METSIWQEYNQEDVITIGIINTNNQNQINKFKSLAKKEGYNIDKWYGVGTSVFRDAQNSKLVIDMIKKETDIDIEILSKEDEAKYSLYAIIFSFGENTI